VSRTLALGAGVAKQSASPIRATAGAAPNDRPMESQARAWMPDRQGTVLAGARWLGWSPAARCHMARALGLVFRRAQPGLTVIAGGLRCSICRVAAVSTRLGPIRGVQRAAVSLLMSLFPHANALSSRAIVVQRAEVGLL